MNELYALRLQQAMYIRHTVGGSRRGNSKRVREFDRASHFGFYNYAERPLKSPLSEDHT